MDKIFVEKLAIVGKHGVAGHEWSHEQRFVVDIIAYTDTKKAALSDKLFDSLNYTHFCDIARQTIEGESVYLIEKLAALIAGRILEDKRIQKVEVTIRKPSVLPSGVPGVTIERKQTHGTQD
jgi:dihydroneopterin aldolase